MSRDDERRVRGLRSLLLARAGRERAASGASGLDMDGAAQRSDAGLPVARRMPPFFVSAESPQRPWTSGVADTVLTGVSRPPGSVKTRLPSAHSRQAGSGPRRAREERHLPALLPQTKKPRSAGGTTCGRGATEACRRGPSGRALHVRARLAATGTAGCVDIVGCPHRPLVRSAVHALNTRRRRRRNWRCCHFGSHRFRHPRSLHPGRRPRGCLRRSTGSAPRRKNRPDRCCWP